MNEQPQIQGRARMEAEAGTRVGNLCAIADQLKCRDTNGCVQLKGI